MKKRAAHGSSHGGVLWAIVLLLVLELHPSGDCCEATCRPNQHMAYSCDASNLQCRDPTVIARTARGGFASVLNCTLPGKTSQVPANAPTTCPAASGTNGRGNGVCDDEFNIPACKFDDGDCCPATCKRTFIDNSCSPSLFNCRDPNGNKDTVPPTLYGLPMPEDEVFEKTFSSLSQSSDTNIPVATKTVAQCNARVLFNIRRTWTARDAAGNTASASRLYAIVDDQDSIVLGNIVVPVASPTAALPFVRQTLSLGATAPSKTYTWTITPRPGVAGRVVTKTGGSVSVTISNTASTGAELVASAAGSNIYDIALTTAYTGCAAPVTRRNAGTLTLMVTGQPLAVLSPATASIRLSGSVTFVASQSLNPNAGTGSGIT
ncbi:hypothetical protein OEZ85_000581 [Tetradesmus obliquus]|uniref:LNR domain-containing protein n=1 Tax=Tetradesmus obliquus TaxID=3088 RepID=A0ABY8UM71_TETOB|nr:hypothetical protein OEZ85_000581 [Tetradesmus obliquus]